MSVRFAPRSWIRHLMRVTRRRRFPLRSTYQAAPFFIVSSGRSGTTFLRRLLETHSNVHIPPEMHALKTAAMRYRRNRFGPWDQLVDVVVSAYEYQRSFEDYKACVRDLALELKDVRDSDRSLSTIIGSIYRYHAERIAGKKDVILGDKTPINIEALNVIAEIFPDAKIVHMLRDGVDVVHSMLEMRRYDDIALAARRWKRSVEIMRRAESRYPMAIMTVRYEDLIAEPAAVLRKVCDFVGAQYSDEGQSHEAESSFVDIKKHDHLQNALKPAFTTSIGKGRQSLSRTQIRYLLDELGPQLRYSGYQVD